MAQPVILIPVMLLLTALVMAMLLLGMKKPQPVRLMMSMEHPAPLMMSTVLLARVSMIAAFLSQLWREDKEVMEGKGQVPVMLVMMKTLLRYAQEDL